MSKRRSKVFEITDQNINRILLFDESDAEEDLLLDEEDLNFLEDLDFVQRNEDVEKVEVVIEPAASSSSNNGRHVHQQHSTNVDSTQLLQQEPTFKWKNASQVQSTSDLHSNPENYNFGEILIKTNDNPTAFEIFESVSQFNKFLMDILIPQTELYSHQKSHIFSINIEEIRAAFGMLVVMGYRKTGQLRSAWRFRSPRGAFNL